MGGSLAQIILPLAVASATYNANNQLLQWGSQTLAYLFNECAHGTCTSKLEQAFYDWWQGYKFGVGIDEYDRYIPVLLALLQRDADREAIVKTLERIEKEEIGMQSPSAGIEKAATQMWLLKSNP
jgi:hypothetical protein